MALKFCDSMDAHTEMADVLLKGYRTNVFNTARWDIATTGGRNGGGAIELKDTTSAMVDIRPYKGVAPSSGNTFCFGFSFKSASATLPSARTWFMSCGRESLQANKFFHPGVDLNGACHFGINTSGILQCADFSANTTTLNSSPTATASTNICDGNWHWIEIAVVNSSTTGLCSVYIDGSQEINVTTDFRNGSGTSETDVITFENNSTQQSSWYIDDLIIYDDDTSTAGLDYAADFPLGLIEIELLKPNGAGTNSAWTASAGDNYACVDETVPNMNTDYVESTASGQTDTYAFGNLTGSVSAVKSVMVNVYAQNDASRSKSYKAVALSSSSTTEGATVTPPSQYRISQTEIVNDPNTGSAWAEAAVNAAEFGVDSQ